MSTALRGVVSSVLFTTGESLGVTRQSSLTTPPMRTIHQTLMIAAAALGSLSILSPVVAQAPGSGTVLHVSPYAGYMVFGNYLSGPLGTSVSNAPAPIYGSQV